MTLTREQIEAFRPSGDGFPGVMCYRRADEYRAICDLALRAIHSGEPIAWMCKRGRGSVGFATEWHEVEFWQKQDGPCEVTPLYRALEQTNAAGQGATTTGCTDPQKVAAGIHSDAPAAPHSEPQVSGSVSAGDIERSDKELEPSGARSSTVQPPARSEPLNNWRNAIETLSNESPPTQDSRPCTCHPDDNPPVPCPRKFALSECRAAAALGGVPSNDQPKGGDVQNGSRTGLRHSGQSDSPDAVKGAAHPSNAELEALVERYAGQRRRIRDEHSDDESAYFNAAVTFANAIVALRQWRAALEEACVVSWVPFDENDPKGTINKLVAWEQTIALDPQVSSDAAKLRDTYLARAEAAERDAARLDWMQFHGAQVCWSSDGEMCDVRWIYDSEEHRTAPFDDWRAAIDAAMKAKP